MKGPARTFAQLHENVRHHRFPHRLQRLRRDVPEQIPALAKVAHEIVNRRAYAAGVWDGTVFRGVRRGDLYDVHQTFVFRNGV